MQDNKTNNSNSPIIYRQITSPNDPDILGFIKVFQEAFAGPPYFENYSEDYVRDNIVMPHLPYYVCVAKTLEDGVIGVGCIHPNNVAISAEATDFLAAQPKDQIPFDLDKAIYGSELATLSSVRKSGIGGQLMIRGFKWAQDNGYQFLTMRTAELGSNSIRMLERVGAVVLPFVQEVGDKGVESKSEKRAWMYLELAKVANLVAEAVAADEKNNTPAALDETEVGGCTGTGQTESSVNERYSRLKIAGIVVLSLAVIFWFLGLLMALFGRS